VEIAGDGTTKSVGSVRASRADLGRVVRPDAGGPVATAEQGTPAPSRVR
jgi:hypothetical protein